MYLRPQKPSTDPRLRSLLQKAVRRGYASLVERVVALLVSIGDSTWLRSRTVVITFEECWPLGRSLFLDRSLSSKVDALIATTRSTKQKDAAGLGALAHAYRAGDRSMLGIVPDKHLLRMVAESLDRPNDFFRWAHVAAEQKNSHRAVHAAQHYLSAATWEWDKACILAGALLAVRGCIPDIAQTTT